MFAGSVILFRSLPVNQKRSKFTGFCNKPVFFKLCKTCDINIVKTCQSLFSFDVPSVIIEPQTENACLALSAEWSTCLTDQKSKLFFSMSAIDAGLTQLYENTK